MKIRWDVDDNNVVELKIGGFGKNRLTINESEVPNYVYIRKDGVFPFELPDGRPATITIEHQLGTRPIIDLRVDDNLMVPTEKKPVLCAACGKAVKPNDKFCGACGHEMPPAEHYVHRRLVREATGAITILAVLFAIFGPLMAYLSKLNSEPLLGKLAGMNPDDIYPRTVDGQTYTVGELQTLLAWEPWSILIVNLILAVIMGGLALWGRRSPLPAVLIAAATYAVVIVFNAIVDPKTIAQGIIIKVLMIVFLARGIKSALALRAANA